MGHKRSRNEPSETTRAIAKVVAARGSSAVVTVVCHDVPEEMFSSLPGYYEVMYSDPFEIVFSGSGIIIECQASTSASADAAAEYLCTVLTPACLFKRLSNINLDEIKIDVFLSTGILYNAKLLAWDFHYNLAVLQFISNSRLPTADFRSINDYFCVDPADAPPRFQILPCSESFNIIPGTPIVSVSRGFPGSPTGLYYDPGYFRSISPDGFSCNELYEIEDDNYQVDEKSSAYCSGIRADDVIEKVDGRLVNSKLQFFETIWEKTGKSVEFNVLRVTYGRELDLNFVIQEASPQKFHQWLFPHWSKVYQERAESESSDDV